MNLTVDMKKANSIKWHLFCYKRGRFSKNETYFHRGFGGIVVGRIFIFAVVTGYQSEKS
jgi:hypothetical protein